MEYFCKKLCATKKLKKVFFWLSSQVHFFFNGKQLIILSLDLDVKEKFKYHNS
jgi:hypothetical protein